MFQGIEIRNFGAFAPKGQIVPLGDLTYIVGPNNSGKSTILSAYFALASLSSRQGMNLPPVNSPINSSTMGRLSQPFFSDNDFNIMRLSDLLKFHSGEDASYAKANNGPILIRVHGTFDKVESALTLRLDEFPSFQTYNIILEGKEAGRRGLYSALQNTWIFPSYRTFAGPSLQVGTHRVNNINFGLDGSNMIQFLLERYTSRDDKWSIAESWLKRVDPNIGILKSPLKGLSASVETGINLDGASFDVNIAQSGSGLQRALQIICAIVFSPSNSVILIEEPEMNLNPAAQEILVDLFNTAVNQWQKQIIVTTHSWDMILEAYSDIGPQSNGRGKDHVATNAESFRLVKLSSPDGCVYAESYDLRTKKFDQLKIDFKRSLG